MTAISLAVIPALVTRSETRGVPVPLLIGLLVICVFAPYGLFPFGGGALRPDHLAVPAIFVFALFRGWLRSPGPLASGLLIFVAFATVSTAFSPSYAEAAPLSAYKALDGLLRGPMILIIASSIAASRSDIHLLVRTFVGIAFVLAGMAFIERVMPFDFVLVSAFADMYGGGAYQEGAYAALNHKGLMFLAHRASAVFPTAPALAMTAVLFVGLAILPGIPITTRQRHALIVAAVAAGFLSNSKSFLFGVPLAFVVGFRGLSAKQLVAILVVIAVLAGGFILVAARTAGDALAANVLSPDVFSSLYSMSGGRFGGDSRVVSRVTATVLSESPLLGYGLGDRPGLIYSDSGLNTILLRAGLLGFVAVSVGILGQLAWFRHGARVTRWSALGSRTLILSVAFCLAGAVFVMPRLNDVIFTFIGVSIAIVHQVLRRSHPSRAIPT